nr:reverse transcriptase domain-containing protein [Tanacetum cinerariifolium]
MMNTKEHEKRHASRHSRSPRPSPSVFLRIRRNQSRSPNQNSREKERGVFKRLGSRGRSVSARSDSHNQRSYSRYIEALLESKDSGGGHSKSRSKNMKSSREEDDLSQPWVCEEIDPFTPRIRYFDFPKTRMPNHINTCDGSEDPKDHLKNSKQSQKQNDGLCRLDSYDDLKKAFLENDLQQKKCIKYPIELHNIKQRDRESTEDFVRRYKLESKDVKGAPEYKEEGTEGPMIIEAEIGGHCIHRMYVDGGSDLEILYEHCFNRHHPKIKNQLVPATTPLIGFSGEIICPIGQIQLLYNEIIRRPGVRKLRAVLSIAHGMLKLPIEGGVIALKSSMLVSLECALVFGPEETFPDTKPILEERVKVEINLEYPEQAVMIGSTLTEGGHNKLCGLLYRNLDIFAWKLADMTGVPRYIAEHCLNMQEGCSLVRQKKKGQGADRNQAIQEEVGKHMEAEIMMEVHYHDWLSNPVMRLVDKVFHKQIRRNLKVYMDDLVIKSRTKYKIVRDIEKTFKTLREINMKLNPKKCTFGVEEWMFLGYKVNTKGLKVCPDKVDAVLSLHPQTEEAFKQMKQLIAELPMLTAPMEKEELIVYLASAKEMILADSIVERPKEDSLDTLMEVEEELPEPWILFMNGSSCTDGSGAGLILTIPEGIEFTYVLRFRFDAINSEAEYEALIVGLRIAEQMGVKNLQANVDSRLVDNQVNGTYVTKEVDMIRYLEKGIDIVGPFPEGPGKVKFLIVAIDYFTKWIKAKPVATITGNQIKKIMWDNIVCRFGLPGAIISDNGKYLGEGIKARLDARSNNWMEELPHVLWAHRTMIKSSNGDTQFLLTYETKAVIPAEINMPTLRTAEVDLVQNDEALRINLDLLEEKREQATIREAKSKTKMEKYYNSKV